MSNTRDRPSQGSREAITYASECPESVGTASFASGETLVKEGRFLSRSGSNTRFDYASVPLMLILSGAVVIVENDVPVKTKVAGDLIGDFEVAHVLNSRRNERVGRWNVMALSHVEVLLYDRSITDSAASQPLGSALVESTRLNAVPTPVSSLPLLDWTATQFSPGVLEDTLLVACTHLLPTSTALLRHLVSLVGYENSFVLEKAYSTIRHTYADLVFTGVDVTPVLPVSGLPYEAATQRSIELLWNKVASAASRSGIRRIVVFDDGGLLLTSVPWPRLRGIEVSGFEQTTSGINRRRTAVDALPPTVDVAGSWAKRHVEAEFIGRAVVAKLEDLELLHADTRIGVIGGGAIGNAIRDAGAHRDTCVLDIGGPVPASSLDAFIDNSDVLIGCSGSDSLRRVALDRLRGSRVFVSASSGDVEFFSLLNMAGFPDKAFETVEFSVHPNFQATVLNAGFPINFDRCREWESGEDMQLTRSLLYIAFVQALELKSSVRMNELVALDRQRHDSLLEAFRNLRKEDHVRS